MTLTPKPTLVVFPELKGLAEGGFWADELKTEEMGLMGSLATELTNVEDTCPSGQDKFKGSTAVDQHQLDVDLKTA